MKPVPMLLLAAVMSLTACGAPSQTIVAPAPQLTLPALRNALYHSPDWGDMQLADGIYLRPTPIPGGSPDAYRTDLREPTAFGDLNGDGIDDAIVFLSTQNGGTGHFVELAAVINRDGHADNVATVSLGDRVGIEGARIEAGVIVLDMRVHGPNDPLCCASQLETWRFRLEGNQLVKLP